MIGGLEGVEFERPMLAYAALPLAVIVYMLMTILWRRLGPGAWTLNPLARWASAGREPRSRILDAARIIIIALVFVAAANPYLVIVEEKTVASTEEARLSVEPRPGLIIMLDVSGSMAGEKLLDAVTAVQSMVSVLDPRIDVGLIAFSDKIEAFIPPTSDRTRVLELLGNLTALGGTMYTYPLATAYSMLKIYREHGLPAYLVIVSDGMPADANEALNEVKSYAMDGIRIHAVLIGNDTMGLDLLEEITGMTGGEVYNIQDTEELARVLEDIARQVNDEIKVKLNVELKVQVERKEPVTHIIAYTLALTASIASVIRYRRVRAEP